jgi:hypothetical protein
LRILLLGISLFAAAPARADQPTERDEQLAQQRYTAARLLYDGSDFGGALVAFRSSFALRASPNTSLYIARCLRRLGRGAEAAQELERTISLGLRNPERYTRAVATARDEAAELEPQIARLTIRVHDAPWKSLLRIGGRLASPDGVQRFPVEPGQVEVVLEPPSGPPLRQRVELVAGSHGETLLRYRRIVAPTSRPMRGAEVLAPAERPRRKIRNAGIVVSASGAASLIASLVLWRVTAHRYDDLAGRCGGQPCPPELHAEIEAGRGLQTATNVTLGAGLGLAAVGAALLVTSRVRDGAAVRRASVAVGAGGLIVSGAF